MFVVVWLNFFLDYTNISLAFKNMKISIASEWMLGCPVRFFHQCQIIKDLFLDTFANSLKFTTLNAKKKSLKTFKDWVKKE